MKIIRLSLTILILTMPFMLRSQEEVHFDHGCNFNSYKIFGDYFLFKPSVEAEKIVDTILKVINFKERSFILKSANVANAQATIKDENTRYLLYSNEFLNKFTKDARTRWAAYTVFAHEIAHHIKNHNLKDTIPSNRKKYELEADDFAARVLAELGADRDDALAAIDALVEEKSNFYPPKSARREAMGNAYDEKRASINIIKKTSESANRTIVNINPNSYNKWSIIQKENVKATIDDEKLIIQITNISNDYSNQTLSIKLLSNDGNMTIKTVDSTGDNLKFEKNKTITWRYKIDDVTKNIASDGDKLRLGVYTMNDKPQKVGGLGLSISSVVLGAGSIGYGIVQRDKALKDHAIFKSKTNENDAVYSTITREDLYKKANDSYQQAQIFIVGGVVVAALGVWSWIKKASTNNQAKDAGYGYVPTEKKRWKIEPLVTANGEMGIMTKF
jgi:hypothetical protein